MIELRHLTKAFGERKVLDDVSHTFARGDTSVILGPSGTGKSVLSRILLGLERPDHGTVHIGGTEITGLTERELLKVRRNLGVCFQDGALFNSMSVGENVAFPLRRHAQLAESALRDRVRDLLRLVGLPGAEAKWPAELSGGMRKRVGIARAIALDPDVLILDEPTSGLDPIMASAIDALIREMKPGRTMLVISHDLDSTRTIADHVCVLHEGRFVATGTWRELAGSGVPVVKAFFARGGIGAS